MNRRIACGHIMVEYSDQGRGRPIVLLHGYLEAKEVWQPLISILEEDHRVIAIDLPGHGASGVNGESHSMDYLATIVKEVIDRTGEKKVILAGHSLGGYVALSFVEKYPELLAGYILFHSHANADTPETIAKRKREIEVVRAGKKNIMYPANISMMFAERNLPLMPDALKRSKEIASHIPAEGITAMLNGMMTRPSRIHVIESGSVPLLWMLGKWDNYFSPEKAIGNTVLPPNAKVVILEESGHLGFIEETQLSAKVINEFSDSIQAEK